VTVDTNEQLQTSLGLSRLPAKDTRLPCRRGIGNRRACNGAGMRGSLTGRDTLSIPVNQPHHVGVVAGPVKDVVVVDVVPAPILTLVDIESSRMTPPTA